MLLPYEAPTTTGRSLHMESDICAASLNFDAMTSDLEFQASDHELCSKQKTPSGVFYQ